MRNNGTVTAVPGGNATAAQGRKRGARLTSVLFVLGLVASLCWPSASASAEDAGLDPVEERFVVLLNEVREQQGLPALRVDPSLTALARTWSVRLSDARALSHNLNLPNEVTANWSKIGENVGYGPDADVIHRKFVESSAHYRNIIDPGYHVVGVGVVRAGDVIYVTQEFVGLQPDPPPTTVAPKPQAEPQVLSFRAVPKPKPRVPTTVKRATPTTKKKVKR